MLKVDPDTLRAAATRWQMASADLGGGTAPPIRVDMAWPSTAATVGIHGKAATATQAFQARIDETAAASHSGANAFHTQDTKGAADAFKDVLSSISSMIGMFSGSMGSVSAATSMLSQLTSTAVSTSTSLVNNLTGMLSHAGGPTHTATAPEHADTAPQSQPVGAARLPNPTRSPTAPGPIEQQPKGFGSVVTV
jgi:hypothetical protein